MMEHAKNNYKSSFSRPIIRLTLEGLAGHAYAHIGTMALFDYLCLFYQLTTYP